jgi:ADP-heptose:LPS heptosyltransferase
MSNIIFQIDGGIGKSVMATAICEAIKKQYPNDNLIVLSGYPEVFLCNPNVHKCFNTSNMQYFYKDYIEGKDVKVLLHNPYLESNFIMRKEHLLETWCNMFNIKYNNEKPRLYLTQREIDFYKKQFPQDKPIFALQTNGGGANQGIKYSWARDIPNCVVEEVIKQYSKEYNILHIRREDQMSFANTIPIQMDFRALVVLISLSTKRLFMDSFAQHVAKALHLPSVVLWIANTPKQFGYDLHKNIEANKENAKGELRHSIFTKYNIGGDLLEFPYFKEEDIFNIHDVIVAINNLKW